MKLTFEDGSARFDEDGVHAIPRALRSSTQVHRFVLGEDGTTVTDKFSGKTDAEIIAFELAGAATADLAEVKTYAVALIKKEAGKRIEASDWQVSRATERADGSLAAVLAARETIRTESNTAETAVTALTDRTAVRNFTW